MFDCTVYLCAFIYSGSSGLPFVISSERNRYKPLLYKVCESDASIKDCIYTIIDEYTNAKPDSVRLFLLETEKKNKAINIYYMCVLPIDTKIDNAYNIPLSLASNNPLVKKSLMYV